MTEDMSNETKDVTEAAMLGSMADEMNPEDFFEDSYGVPDIKSEEAPGEQSSSAPQQEETGIKDDKTAMPADTPDNAPPKTDADTIPFEAYKSEKEKRQALETKNEELNKQIEAFNARQADNARQDDSIQPETMPDMYEDPKGFQTYLERKAEAIADAKLTAYQQEGFKRLIDTSEAKAKAEFTDYDDVVETFNALVKQDADLADKFRRSSDPARFGYETAKNYLENKRLSDPEARKSWEADIRAEERKRVEEELNTQRQQSIADRNKLAMSTPDVLTGGGGGVAKAGLSLEQMTSDPEAFLGE